MRSHPDVRRQLARLGMRCGVRVVLIDHTRRRTVKRLQDACVTCDRHMIMPRIILLGEDAKGKVFDYDVKGYSEGSTIGLSTMYSSGVCTSTFFAPDPVEWEGTEIWELIAKGLAWNLYDEYRRLDQITPTKNPT